MKQILVKVPSPLAIKRAPGWPKLRRAHLKKQSTCQACGKSTGLAVHHITPLHVDRRRELDPENLITLCENARSSFCHYTFGHLAINWWKWDPDVINHAYMHLTAINAANEEQDSKGRQRLKMNK